MAQGNGMNTPAVGVRQLATSEQQNAHSGATTMFVAVTVLTLYVVFVVILITMRDDANWDRLVYLLGGFEAIVFAAIGWIFGTTVARGTVLEAKASQAEAKEQASVAREDAAEERETARAARAERDDSLKDAERGRALAESIKAKQTSSSRQGARPEDTAASPALTELTSLAQRLFPD
jgi:hypothetical protein